MIEKEWNGVDRDGDVEDREGSGGGVVDGDGGIEREWWRIEKE